LRTGSSKRRSKMESGRKGEEKERLSPKTGGGAPKE